MKYSALALFTFLAISANLFPAWEFHVSPGGSDDNPGTQLQPFQTISAARDSVRKINRTMDTDIVVHLHGGRYHVSETIVFGPQDSGSNDHKIIYRAAKGGKPILTGGVPVTGWKHAHKQHTE